MAASLEMGTSKATPGSRNLLNQWFPHTVNPVIASAPMLGIANATLAAQVSKAGGLGVVPGGYLFTPDSPHLVTLAKELKLAREVLGLAEEPSSALPVAVGFLLFDPSVAQFASTTVPLLKQHRVQAVWLFAENVEKYGSIKTIIESLHEAGILAICQVGNVAASRLAVQEGADVIVAQGSDAGGHQFIQNSGLISLVPEVRQMLDTEFPDRQVALMAAGGIAEGRGVAAALALGADGIVMGTRFIIAKEAEAQEYFKTAVIEAVDGGVSTSKSVFHDDLANMNIWPKPYDGRAIISKSYLDHIAGMPLDENQARYAEAQKSGDVARLSVWAGTGVGLVNEVLPAAEIVEKTRAEAKRTAQALQSLL